MLLGDFNAVVESEWSHERVPHCYGKTNEAGKEPLVFVSVDNLPNTCVGKCKHQIGYQSRLLCELQYWIIR